MKRKTMISILISILIVGSLAACTSNSTSSGPSSGTEKTNEKLNIALTANPSSLDPHIGSQIVTGTIALHMAETLLTYDKDYKVVPLLAESIDISKDGKTITFPLRKEVKFHNGKALTADDVIASLTRWGKLAITGRGAMNGVKMEAPDENTVVMKLPKPSITILYDLAYPSSLGPYIYPKEVLDKAGDNVMTEYIGTGPYKFVDWKKEQYVHLTKYDDYKSPAGETSGLTGKKEANVKDLYFRFVPDPTTRLNGIKSGEYDFVEGMPQDQYSQLKDDPNLSVQVLKPYLDDSLVFNNKEGFFSNIKARQAVAAAMNMDEIMLGAAEHKDFYQVTPGLIQQQPAEWYTDKGKEFFNQNNPEKAKELLKEAGYNGETITILTTKDYSSMYNTSLMIQEQLEKIGMKVKLDVYDFPTMLAMRSKSKWNAHMTGFAPPPEPTQIFFLDSRNQHAAGYANPEMDKLMDQIRYAPTKEEAIAAWEKAQQLYWKDVPTIKFGDTFGFNVMQKNMNVVSAFGITTFWNVK
ncbi:MAG: ABC transporter substrate-binding protein [Bacillus sp. (in: firmicutes)]